MGGASDVPAAFVGSKNAAAGVSSFKRLASATQTAKLPQLVIRAPPSLSALASDPAQFKRRANAASSSGKGSKGNDAQDVGAHTAGNLDLSALFPTNIAGFDATSVVYGLATQIANGSQIIAGYATCRSQSTYVTQNFTPGMCLTAVNAGGILLAVATAAVLPAAACRLLRAGMTHDAVQDSIEVGIFFDHDTHRGAGIKHAERERRRLHDHRCKDVYERNTVAAAMYSAHMRHVTRTGGAHAHAPAPAPALAQTPATIMENDCEDLTEMDRIRGNPAVWPPAAMTFAQARNRRYQCMNTIYGCFVMGTLRPIIGSVFVDSGSRLYGHILPHNADPDAHVISRSDDGKVAHVLASDAMYVHAAVDMGATLSTLPNHGARAAPVGSSNSVPVNCHSMVVGLCAEMVAFVEGFGTMHCVALRRHVMACARKYEVAFGWAVCADIARRVLGGEFNDYISRDAQHSVLDAPATRTVQFHEADSLLLHHYCQHRTKILKRSVAGRIDDVLVGDMQFTAEDLLDDGRGAGGSNPLVFDAYAMISVDSDVLLGAMQMVPNVDALRGWTARGWHSAPCPGVVALPLHSMRYMRHELQIIDLPSIVHYAKEQLHETVVQGLRFHERTRHWTGAGPDAGPAWACQCSLPLFASHSTLDNAPGEIRTRILAELFPFMASVMLMCNTDYVHDVSSLVPWLKCPFTPVKVVRAVMRAISMHVCAHGLVLTDGAGNSQFSGFFTRTEGAGMDIQLGRGAAFVVASLLVAEEHACTPASSYRNGKGPAAPPLMPCRQELEIVRSMFAAAVDSVCGNGGPEGAQAGAVVHTTRGEAALVMAVCKKASQRTNSYYKPGDGDGGKGAPRAGKRKRADAGDNGGDDDSGSDDNNCRNNGDADGMGATPQFGLQNPAKRAKMSHQTQTMSNTSASALPSMADVVVAGGYADAVDMRSLRRIGTMVADIASTWSSCPTGKIPFSKTTLRALSPHTIVTELTPVLIGISARTCFSAARVLAEAENGEILDPDVRVLYLVGNSDVNGRVRPDKLINKNGYQLMPHLYEAGQACFKQVHPENLLLSAWERDCWLTTFKAAHAYTQHQGGVQHGLVGLMTPKRGRPLKRAPIVAPQSSRYGARVRGISPSIEPRQQEQQPLPGTGFQPLLCKSDNNGGGGGDDNDDDGCGSSSETYADPDQLREFYASCANGGICVE